MQAKFSFKEATIVTIVGDTVRVFSNLTNVKSKITVKLESNIKKLNGFYTIQPNGLILEFKFEELTTFKAVRIWGAVWNFDGSLDLVIDTQLSTVSTTHVEQKIIKKPHVVSKKSKKRRGFDRQLYFFNKTANNKYKLFLNSNIDAAEISISNNAILEISEQTIGNDEVEISLKELINLDVILQFSYNNRMFNLPGQEIDNKEHLKEAVDQIKWIIENENLNLFGHVDNDKVIITRKDNKVKSIKFHGPLHHIEKIFEKDTPYYECDIVQLRTGDIELTLDNKLFKNCKTQISISEPKEQLHSDFNITFDNNICQINASVNGAKEYMLISKELGYSNLQIATDSELVWRINTDKFNGVANFTLRSEISSITKSITINKQQRIPKLYHKMKNFKNFSYLYVYSNQESNYTHDIELKILDNSTTKLNQDFSIPQKNFVIEKGQKKKKIKINWLNKKAFKEFKIQVGNIIIPVKYVDADYYPSHLKIEKNTHILNKGVNKDLTLRYYDSYTTGEIVLAPMRTTFEYFPTNSTVEWELYDGKNMIWRKEFHYSLYQPQIEIVYPKNTKFGMPFDIKFKLNREFTKPIKLKIHAISNLSNDLNKIHQIKLNEKEKVFTITPKKTKAIGWIAFRAESLTEEVSIDQSKKVIMVD